MDSQECVVEWALRLYTQQNFWVLTLISRIIWELNEIENENETFNIL